MSMTTDTVIDWANDSSSSGHAYDRASELPSCSFSNRQSKREHRNLELHKFRRAFRWSSQSRGALVIQNRVY